MWTKRRTSSTQTPEKQQITKYRYGHSISAPRFYVQARRILPFRKEKMTLFVPPVHPSPKRHTPPTRLTNLQGSASKAHRAFIHTRNHAAVPPFNTGVYLFNSAVLPFNDDVSRIFRQSTRFMKGTFRFCLQHLLLYKGEKT